MSLEFTKLSEAAVAESISEEAHVLIEDGGEVKRVAKSKVGGGGKITQEQLPAGYPWDGRTVIEWDGNTEGHYVVADLFVHISEEVPDLTATGLSLSFGGETYTGTQFIALPVAEGVYSTDIESEAAVFVITNPGVDADGIVFERTGVYFSIVDSPVSLEYSTVVKMKAEFVPRGELYVCLQFNPEGGYIDDGYLYKDPVGANKATKTDFENAVKCGMCIEYGYGGNRFAVLTPVATVHDEAWGEAICVVDTEMTVKVYRTAEYTAS